MACDLKRNLHQMSGATSCYCGDISVANGNAPRRAFESVVEMFDGVDLKTLSDDQVEKLRTRQAVLRRKGSK